MTKTHYPFPSIEQFSHVRRNVQWKAQYRGHDENNEPIMDRTAQMPVLAYIGTTKLHGTNFALVLSKKDFVTAVLNEGRLEQGYNWLKENNKAQDQSGTGEFIRWIFQDVLKECKLEMEASGIQEKELGKLLANPAKKWYFNRINTF